jgi:hypothetical protein
MKKHVPVLQILTHAGLKFHGFIFIYDIYCIYLQKITVIRLWKTFGKSEN